MGASLNDPNFGGGHNKGKGKKVQASHMAYSLLSVGPGADPGVQAVSPQVTISHPPGGRLPLLSARPALPYQPQSIKLPLGRYPVILLGDRGT